MFICFIDKKQPIDQIVIKFGLLSAVKAVGNIKVTAPNIFSGARNRQQPASQLEPGQKSGLGEASDATNMFGAVSSM